ncbi:unnamed protein product, partial [Rotaria sp. Silwood2]
EQLREMFDEGSSIPITIQFDNKRSESIDIKICTVTEMTATEEETIPTETKIKVKQALIPYAASQPRRTSQLRANPAPYSPLQRSRCALCINRIGLVQMPGESGTRIQDDMQTTALSNDDQYRQYLSATVNEDAFYRLHVQLDCGGHLSGDSLDNPCSRFLSVTVWIDFNDNELDESESRPLQPAWSNNDVPTGIYNLDVYIPKIDGRNTKAGSHRMRITVMPSEDYQRDCGRFSYKEIRDYSINIIPIKEIKVETTTRFICPINIAKITLVIMAGEKGTEIRDDKPVTSLSPNYINQHHMAVTLFEHTVYLLRIQLDCSSQLKTQLTPTGCNLAQDVNVWIDLNDDGKFDDSEIGAPYRWPVTSYMAEGIYDIQIYVPLIDSRYMKNGQHRMRISVSPSDYYQRLCGEHNYLETLEYMVTIIPRMKYSCKYSSV